MCQTRKSNECDQCPKGNFFCARQGSRTLLVSNRNKAVQDDEDGRTSWEICLRVALTLTPNMLSNIATMMVQEKANIQGHYLLCRTNSNRAYRGADTLSECVREVDLKQPEGFMWTGLRKHLATLSQVHEISETSQDQLAQFMGHSIRVHRDFYRLPMAVVQCVKVAKVPLAAHLGHHHPHSKFGKTSWSIRKVIEISLNTISLSLI